MDKIFNWGIIGPGRIARKFAAALALAPGARLQAVASRDRERAREFAHAFGAPTSYGNYEELAADGNIDAVYIATPHSYHHAHSILCLRHKKAVLCEKPLSVNYESAREIVEAARRESSFLMEAIWTRFLPIIAKTIELINAGEIGELKYLRSDFGFAASFDPQGRLFNPKLGGGALLDLGIYPLFLALLLLGVPDELKSFSSIGPTGIDESTEASLFYKDGRMASMQASICAQTPIRADIAGTTGALVVERPWYKGSNLLLLHQDKVKQAFSLPFGENGFEFEIMEVQRCLGMGLTESPLLPLDFTLSLSKMMDTISRTAGINYSRQPL